MTGDPQHLVERLDHVAVGVRDMAATTAMLELIGGTFRNGGDYVAGGFRWAQFHLPGSMKIELLDVVDDEAWSARRGNLTVNSYMWSRSTDRRRRVERLGMTFDVYTPTRHVRIEDDMAYRTYGAAQMRALLARVPELEIAETYDFAYDVRHPVRIDGTTEDVVFVLRRR